MESGLRSGLAQVKKIGIYKITSPSNRVYIGQSVDIDSRFGVYKKLKCKKQIRLYNSFLKYGFNNHKFDVICECNRDKLNDLEVYYIGLYQSFNSEFGLNLQSGGGARTVFSDESRKKMSESCKRTRNFLGKKHSDESKLKIRLKAIGRVVSEATREKHRINGTERLNTKEARLKMIATRKAKNNYKHSPETIKKIKETCSTQEFRLRMKNIMLGRKHSEETKIKISKNSFWRGIGPMKGKHHSEETKKKLSKHESIMVLNTQTGIFYDSIKDGAFSIGVHHSVLSKKLSGYRKNNETSFIYANN